MLKSMIEAMILNDLRDAGVPLELVEPELIDAFKPQYVDSQIERCEGMAATAQTLAAGGLTPPFKAMQTWSASALQHRIAELRSLRANYP